MENKKSTTSKISNTITISRLAIYGLFAATVVVIVLFVAVIVIKQFKQMLPTQSMGVHSSTKFLNTLIDNTTVTTINVYVKGTVEKVDNTSITIKNGKDSVTVPINGNTAIVRLATRPSQNNAPPLPPTLEKFSASQLKIGQLVEATIDITRADLPVAKTITVLTPSAKTASLNMDATSANQLPQPPYPPLPPGKNSSSSRQQNKP